MPQIKLTSEETPTAIQIPSKSAHSSGNKSTNEQQDKKYLINDGTTCVFKEGKLNLVVSPENMKRVNIFLNDAQKGEITIYNVTDHLYNDATVVCNLIKKEINLKPSFKGDKPNYLAKLDLVIVVEEVDEKQPTNKFLRRNKDFVTPTVVEKLKQTVKTEMESIIEYCKENKVDLIGVYRNFYHREHKKFKEYVESVGLDNYLNNVDYQIDISVTTEY